MNAQNSICINIHMEKPYMSRREFARQIGVSEKTVDKLREQDEVKFVKLKDESGKETKNGTVLIDLAATLLKNIKRELGQEYKLNVTAQS